MATAILGRFIQWRYGAPTAFYGLLGTRTAEAAALLTDSTGQRWQLTATADYRHVGALTEVVLTLARTAPTATAEDLRAAAAALAVSTPGALTLEQT